MKKPQRSNVAKRKAPSSRGPRAKARRPKRPPQLKPIDVTNYPGEWLALDPLTHEILGHSHSLRIAVRRGSSKGVERPLMMFVPESDAYFVGVG